MASWLDIKGRYFQCRCLDSQLMTTLFWFIRNSNTLQISKWASATDILTIQKPKCFCCRDICHICCSDQLIDDIRFIRDSTTDIAAEKLVSGHHCLSFPRTSYPGQMVGPSVTYIFRFLRCLWMFTSEDHMTWYVFAKCSGLTHLLSFASL